MNDNKRRLSDEELVESQDLKKQKVDENNLNNQIINNNLTNSIEKCDVNDCDVSETNCDSTNTNLNLSKNVENDLNDNDLNSDDIDNSNLKSNDIQNDTKIDDNDVNNDTNETKINENDVKNDTKLEFDSSNEKLSNIEPSVVQSNETNCTKNNGQLVKENDTASSLFDQMLSGKDVDKVETSTKPIEEEEFSGEPLLVNDDSYVLESSDTENVEKVEDSTDDPFADVVVDPYEQGGDEPAESGDDYEPLNRVVVDTDNLETDEVDTEEPEQDFLNLDNVDKDELENIEDTISTRDFIDKINVKEIPKIPVAEVLPASTNLEKSENLSDQLEASEEVVDDTVEGIDEIIDEETNEEAEPLTIVKITAVKEDGEEELPITTLGNMKSSFIQNDNVQKMQEKLKNIEEKLKNIKSKRKDTDEEEDSVFDEESEIEMSESEFDASVSEHDSSDTGISNRPMLTPLKIKAKKSKPRERKENNTYKPIPPVKIQIPVAKLKQKAPVVAAAATTTTPKAKSAKTKKQQKYLDDDDDYEKPIKRRCQKKKGGGARTKVPKMKVVKRKLKDSSDEPDDDKAIINDESDGALSDSFSQTSSRSKGKDPHDNPKLSKYKNFLNLAGIKVNYAQLWEDCNSTKERAEKIIEKLRQHGLKGKATNEKCMKLRKKVEIAQEVAELGVDPTVVESGRKLRQRKTNTNYFEDWGLFNKVPNYSPPKPKKTFSRIKRVADSSDSD